MQLRLTKIFLIGQCVFWQSRRSGQKDFKKQHVTALHLRQSDHKELF